MLDQEKIYFIILNSLNFAELEIILCSLFQIKGEVQSVEKI